MILEAELLALSQMFVDPAVGSFSVPGTVFWAKEATGGKQGKQAGRRDQIDVGT